MECDRGLRKGGGWSLDEQEHTPAAQLCSSSGDHHSLYQARTCSLPSRSWTRNILLVLLPLLPEKAIPESISFTLLSSKLKCCMGTSGWKSLYPDARKTGRVILWLLP